jgi:phosphatidylinositol 4-kinase
MRKKSSKKSKADLKKKSSASISITNNLKNEIQTLNYFKEQDVLLSKPIIIRNINHKKNKEIKKEKKKKEIDKVKFSEEEEEEYKKIDEFLRKRVTVSYVQYPKRNSRSDQLFLLKPNNQAINDVRMSKISDDSEIKFKAVNLIEESTIDNNHLKNSNFRKFEGDASSENEIPTEIFFEEIKPKDPIFGEKFEDQTKRLRKNSPFGNCSSWKLFKMIVKSGEDLRQEQFATQLINEFYQIFKLEKIEVWLKPYEILSTGINVGIIECVPNAVSLDYLKRKATNFTTLRQYFEQYYGGSESDSTN